MAKFPLHIFEVCEIACNVRVWKRSLKITVYYKEVMVLFMWNEYLQMLTTINDGTKFSYKIPFQHTMLISFLSPSFASNSAKIARKEKVSEKNIVAWQRPELWEHSSNHNTYLTTSPNTGCGRRQIWNKFKTRKINSHYVATQRCNLHLWR